MVNSSDAVEKDKNNDKSHTADKQASDIESAPKLEPKEEKKITVRVINQINDNIFNFVSNIGPDSAVELLKDAPFGDFFITRSGILVSGYDLALIIRGKTRIFTRLIFRYNNHILMPMVFEDNLDAIQSPTFNGFIQTCSALNIAIRLLVAE